MATPRLIIVDGKIVGVTDPEKQQSIPIGDSAPTPSKITYGSSPRRSSRRKSSSKKPDEVYESEKLQQSFTSREAKQQAEREFEQRKQRETQQERIQEIREREAVQQQKQDQQRPQFSGRVQRVTEEGQPQEERYFVEGRETRRVQFEEGEPTSATTRTPSRFTFRTEQDGFAFDERTEFDAEGAVMDVSRSIAEEPNRILNSIRSASLELSRQRQRRETEQKEGGTIFIKESELSKARIYTPQNFLEGEEKRAPRTKGEEVLARVNEWLKVTDDDEQVLALTKDKIKDLQKVYNRPRAFREYARQTPYKELFEKGQLNLIPLKASQTAGGAFLSFTGSVTGAKRKFELSEAEKKIGGDILGESFLFMGVAPFARTSAGMSKQLAREGQRIQLAQLDKQLIKTKTPTIGGSGGSRVFQVEGTRQFWGIKQKIDIIGKTTPTSQKEILGLTGRGYVTPRADVAVTTRGVFDYTLRNQAGTAIRDRIFSIDTFELGVKSVVGGTNKYSTALSKIVQVDPRTGVGEVSWGQGFAQQRPAQVTSLKNIQQTSGFQIVKGSGRRAGDITKFNIKRKTIGVGKDFIISKKDIGNIGFQGGGKQSSTQFFKQLYGTDAKTIASSIMGGVRTSTKPMIVSAKPITQTATTTTAGAGSIYAGRGVYEQTRYSVPSIMGMSSPQKIKRFETQTTTTKLTQDFRTAVDVKPIIKQDSYLRTGVKQRQIQPQPVKLIDKQLVVPAQKQLQPQKLNYRNLLKQQPTMRYDFYSYTPIPTPKIKIPIRGIPKIPKIPPFSLFPLKRGQLTPKRRKKTRAEDVQVEAQDYISKQLKLRRLRLV